jgi:hypothetical protein
VKSLVGRNPAVSSTTVEATTNFAHHRPPVTEISFGTARVEPPRSASTPHLPARQRDGGKMGRHGDETDDTQVRIGGGGERRLYRRAPTK